MNGLILGSILWFIGWHFTSGAELRKAPRTRYEWMMYITLATCWPQVLGSLVAKWFDKPQWPDEVNK